ncbi:unnamed protein product [Rotaria socialis]|uniref:Uncharacterized protein n=1 Tax=Rotaria socialis TaxID=392032 RepID=A0A817WEE2_9BILA|nr:unnamed protein product [Rotaria socialis]CAF4188767.1 unnamed protein product [Rotaria socialis]
MATNKSFFRPYNYQIAPRIITAKFRSKSSDSVSNHNNNNQKIDSQKQENKISKMKKSQTTLTDFETKPLETTCNTTSMLRRRFSLFRIKRSQQANENVNVHALQQIIDNLRHDLQNKTDELQTIKKHVEKKRHSIIQLPDESIEQALQMQTTLNGRLEEMLTEKDLLKKRIQELESYAQQTKRKRHI